MQIIPDWLKQLLTDSAWLRAVAQLWTLGREALQSRPPAGMYEVLEYESTLELLDRRGEQAVFRKRQRVRYLQDNIIAYQDQAWGDGDFLRDYRCSPGVPVDFHRLGQKTHILIARREVKSRGDVDEFNIERKIQGGFRRGTEAWETDISHPTQRLSVRIIYPKSRPPRRVSVAESDGHRSTPLGEDRLVQLPDDRWLVSWELAGPRLHERYTLKWEW